MSHFDVVRWADYVRGLASAGEAKDMESHLAGGCAVCGRLVALLSRIQSDSAEEPDVPGYLVEAAKAVFPRHEADTVKRWLSWPRLAARLLSDASYGFAPEGTRAISEPMVELVYEAGDYSIELQIEREPDSAAVAIVGAIANRAGAAAVRDIPVLLVAGNRLMARSETNRSGEFWLTASVQPRMRICVPIEDTQYRVDIPLTRNVADLQ
jgi:anti-sigma factor RsiW